jgi:hypothetical protein
MALLASFVSNTGKLWILSIDLRMNKKFFQKATWRMPQLLVEGGNSSLVTWQRR